jgi:hypothetical protein
MVNNYRFFSYFVRNSETTYLKFSNALIDEFGKSVKISKTIEIIKDHRKKRCFFLSLDEVDKLVGDDALRYLFSNITPFWDDINANFFFYGSALAVGSISKFQTFSGRNVKVIKWAF